MKKAIKPGELMIMSKLNKVLKSLFVLFDHNQ